MPKRGVDHSHGAEQELPAEASKSLSVQEIFLACDIAPNEPISVEKIELIFERFPQLIEGARRNFYWKLRQAITADFARSLNGGRFYNGRSAIEDIGAVTPFRENSDRSKQSPFQPRTGITEREALFGELEKKSPGAEIRFEIGTPPSQKLLIFLFQTTPENARLYWSEGESIFGVFTSPTDFQFKGIYTAEDITSPKQLLATQVPSPEHQVDYDKLTDVIECLIPFPDTDVQESLTHLRSLAEKENLDDETIEKLSTAIQTFATFVKPPPITDRDLYDEIGRCLTIPLSFSEFCHKRFGLNVTEERYGNGVSFYHQVNRFGDLLIDWTAGQYPQYADAPYPRIYHIQQPLFGGTRPYSLWTEEEKQEAIKLSRLAASGREY
jgi:hypothetical protein